MENRNNKGAAFIKRISGKHSIDAYFSWHWLALASFKQLTPTKEYINTCTWDLGFKDNRDSLASYLCTVGPEIISNPISLPVSQAWDIPIKYHPKVEILPDVFHIGYML